MPFSVLVAVRMNFLGAAGVAHMIKRLRVFGCKNAGLEFELKEAAKTAKKSRSDFIDIGIPFVKKGGDMDALSGVSRCVGIPVGYIIIATSETSTTTANPPPPTYIRSAS